MDPISPPVPIGKVLRKDVDVKAFLHQHFSGVSERVAKDEDRRSKVYVFRVKKLKKSNLTGGDLLFSKRIMEVNLNTMDVRYLREVGSSQGSIFPGPDRVYRTSIVLDNEVALDFFFVLGAWKHGKTHLRLFFKSMRERDMFHDLYSSMASPNVAEEVTMRTATKKLGSRIQRGGPEGSEGGNRGSAEVSSASIGSGEVSVMVATWNMGNEAAPVDLSAWLRHGCDIVAVAAQETNLTRKQEGDELQKQRQQDDAVRGEVLLEVLTGEQERHNQHVAAAASEEMQQQSASPTKGITASFPNHVAAAAEGGGAAELTSKEAKVVKKKAQKAIHAAAVSEIQEKKSAQSKALRDYEKLRKEAKSLAREARRDKGKADVASERKVQAASAKQHYMELKNSTHTRKKELASLAKNITVDQAASVLVSGEKLKKKDTHFINRIRAHMFKDTDCDYAEVAYVALWGMKLVVFVKRALLSQVSCVDWDSVPCGGPGGNYGNKGGVAVSLWFGWTSFCFVAGHLAAHTEKLKLRNANYHRIMQELTLGMKEWPVVVKHDHIFFFGDLNYRIDMPQDTALKHLKEGNIDALLQADQLHAARLQEQAFAGFDEAEPRFYPTFKLLKGGLPLADSDTGFAVIPLINREPKPGEQELAQPATVSYDLQRVPSFCDRILVRSAKYAKHRIRRQEYNAVFSLTTSDHAPIFSTFSCGVDMKKFVALEQLQIESSSGSCFILLSSLLVRVKPADGGLDISRYQLFDNAYTLSALGPTFLNSPKVECTLPAKPWETTASPLFLGSLALACRPGISVENIRPQKLFLRVVSSDESFRGYGVLKLDSAFVSLGRMVPFECELYGKSTPLCQQIGLISGTIHSSFTT